jgi:hypothetical protein
MVTNLIIFVNSTKKPLFGVNLQCITIFTMVSFAGARLYLVPECLRRKRCPCHFKRFWVQPGTGDDAYKKTADHAG